MTGPKDSAAQQELPAVTSEHRQPLDADHSRADTSTETTPGGSRWAEFDAVRDSAQYPAVAADPSAGESVLPEFEAWLRTVCFQEPTPDAYHLAKRAWKEALMAGSPGRCRLPAPQAESKGDGK